MTDAVASPGKTHDRRLDVFRGLALIFITITHTHGNWLAELLPPHFGFSSGTEMFAFCSGFASGLAAFVASVPLSIAGGIVLDGVGSGVGAVLAVNAMTLGGVIAAGHLTGFFKSQPRQFSPV